MSSEVETKVLETGPPERAEVHRYGVAPIPFIAAFMLLGFVVGLALLLDGHVIAGVVLVLAALALALLFAAEITEAVADGRVGRGVRYGAGAARSRAQLSWLAISGWSGAAPRLVHLRLERGRLERRLRDLTREIGEAFYAGDVARAETLKAEARAVAANVEELEAERQVLGRSVRDRIDARRPRATS